jgi:hypothetical protein
VKLRTKALGNGPVANAAKRRRCALIETTDIRNIIYLIIALLLLILASRADVPPHRLQPRVAVQEIPKRKGHWVMSESGKAVFCTGPTVFTGGFGGRLAHFATGCIGRQGSIVKLHE